MMGRAHRLGAALAVCLAALLTALIATGCAAPQFTYVADSGASTYFKVPYGWHKIDSGSIAAKLTGAQGSSRPQPGVWIAGYDAAAAPSADHLFSPTAGQPFAFAVVFPLSSAARNAMSYDGLRDILLPVTPVTRATAAQHGFPLTGFHLLRDSVLAPSPAAHGVRVTFDYTYPGGSTDTFDQVAFANADNTQVFVLLVHCLATCYRQHQKEINTVMASFTVHPT